MNKFFLLSILSVIINFSNAIDEKHSQPLSKITKKVFFDVQINGVKQERIVFGLFGEDTPKTVENFIEITKGGKMV